MIKWMLTAKCGYGCDYCITRNVDIEESTDFRKITSVLADMSLYNEDIMITGGEPTASKMFNEKMAAAVGFFGKAFITSANPAVLTADVGDGSIHGVLLTRGITFSRHGRDIWQDLPYPIIAKKIPVYLAIMADEYSHSLARNAYIRGYSGLSINEEQRNGEPFEADLKEYPHFSYKINRRGHCLDDTQIILPDMTIIDSFRPLLGE